MKIVLDTNVLVSGLLKVHSNAGMIVRMIAGGLIQVVYDSRIIAEYREVLYRPKFDFDKKDIEAIISQIEDEGILVTAKPLNQKLPDPDDAPFLEVALAVDGAVLVTGNKKHFPEASCGYVNILSPAEFISVFRDSY
ncbi:MAG: putative toxin-antitoxin system toxin component, PIN family [Syntrophomonadaceae bacterium]|nr:putative toxin-antitoxin system toxin component, PIN family [Syntrophomonadaceae bacterium]